MFSHGGDLFTATAYQALLPRSAYGIAVMANTGSGLRRRHTALGEALVALLDSAPVLPAVDPSVTVDAVLLVLSVGAFAASALGAARARR